MWDEIKGYILKIRGWVDTTLFAGDTFKQTDRLNSAGDKYLVQNANSKLTGGVNPNIDAEVIASRIGGPNSDFYLAGHISAGSAVKNSYQLGESSHYHFTAGAQFQHLDDKGQSEFIEAAYHRVQILDGFKADLPASRTFGVRAGVSDISIGDIESGLKFSANVYVPIAGKQHFNYTAENSFTSYNTQGMPVNYKDVEHTKFDVSGLSAEVMLSKSFMKGFGEAFVIAKTLGNYDVFTHNETFREGSSNPSEITESQIKAPGRVTFGAGVKFNLFGFGKNN